MNKIDEILLLANQLFLAIEDANNSGMMKDIDARLSSDIWDVYEEVSRMQKYTRHIEAPSDWPEEAKKALSKSLDEVGKAWYDSVMNYGSCDLFPREEKN